MPKIVLRNKVIKWEWINFTTSAVNVLSSSYYYILFAKIKKRVACVVIVVWVVCLQKRERACVCVGVDLRVFMIPKGESSCKAAVVDGNKGKKREKEKGKK